FVVAGTARDDDFAAVGRGGDARRERRRFPQVERIDRLNVVVAVEQDVRGLAASAAAAIAALGDDDGVALGRAHAGVEADAGEIVGNELGGGAALVLVGRVGRDRLDLEELEQSLKARIKIGVDLVEDSGKRLRKVGHVEVLVRVCASPSAAARGPKHYMPASRTPRRVGSLSASILRRGATAALGETGIGRRQTALT